LKNKRAIGNQQVFQWTELVRRLNPHISDVNRIFPNERILLPDHLQESVSPAWIWQNVFSHIPPSLTFAYHGPLTVYFVHAGDSIDTVAQHMFDTDRYRCLPLSAKRAVLLHNNPILERHLHTRTLPPKMVLDVTPVSLSQLDQAFWKCHQTAIANHLDQLDFELLNHYENTGPEHVGALTEMVTRLKDYGASVGMNDLVKASGYAIGGVSGYASSATSSLGHVNQLLRELCQEAVAKFGHNVVTSKNSAHLDQMQRFLKSHPKYREAMRYLEELPKNLLPKGNVMPSAAQIQANNGVARHFRKTYILPYNKWSSARFFNSAAKQLNGKLGFFKALGKHATWYIPATLGLISMANAPQEVKMRTLFEEGFSIIGGFLGTELGHLAATNLIVPAAAKLMTFCGLCLGPWGMFVLVAICCVGAGWYFMERFKEGGAKFYDYGSQHNDGKIYHSFDQLFEGF
jgi:hypothetical protein